VLAGTMRQWSRQYREEVGKPAVGLPIGVWDVGAGRLVVQGEAVEFNNTCGWVELVELDLNE
jgi:hypothetical protein